MSEKKVRPLVSAGSPRRARIPMHRTRHWVVDGEDGRTPGIQVFVTQAAFREINAHANTDLDNEVGGWLAGRWCRDIETRAEFVVVEALLPAQQVRSGSTFLTFTHDSQVAMLAALEERYASKGIVGWYHTHPRMGLFLSGYDLWLHEHFFPHPWQVALVVDPHTHTGGFFIRSSKDELDSRRHFGFYELLSRKGESSVDWRNIRPAKGEEAKTEQPPKPQQPKTETKIATVEAVETRDASVKVEPREKQIEVKPARPQIKTGETQPVIVKRVAAAKSETENAAGKGVLGKFEGARQPAKVHLQKKSETQENISQGEGKPSQEA